MSTLNTSKKYVAIVKIDNLPNGAAHCVKYRFDNLLKLTAFLDRQWLRWKWFNVYSNRGDDKGIQLASFTNRNRPLTKYL